MLEMKRSQAINIGLTKLPPIRALKQAILNMDSAVIDREGIDVSEMECRETASIFTHLPAYCKATETKANFHFEWHSNLMLLFASSNVRGRNTACSLFPEHMFSYI